MGSLFAVAQIIARLAKQLTHRSDEAEKHHRQLVSHLAKLFQRLLFQAALSLSAAERRSVRILCSWCHSAVVEWSPTSRSRPHWSREVPYFSPFQITFKPRVCYRQRSRASAAIGRVRPSVCFHSTFKTNNRRLTLIFARVLVVTSESKSQDRRSRSRVRKDGNAVGLTSILDRGQFVF